LSFLGLSSQKWFWQIMKYIFETFLKINFFPFCIVSEAEARKGCSSEAKQKGEEILLCLKIMQKLHFFQNMHRKKNHCRSQYNKDNFALKSQIFSFSLFESVSLRLLFLYEENFSKTIAYDKIC